MCRMRCMHSYEIMNVQTWSRSLGPTFLIFTIEGVGLHWVLMLISLSFNKILKNLEYFQIYKKYSDSPESPHIPFTQFPLLLTSYITVVYSPQLKNQHWHIVINCLSHFIWISPVFLIVILLCQDSIQDTMLQSVIRSL